MLPSADRGRGLPAARESSLTREETADETSHVATAWCPGYGVHAPGRDGGRGCRAGAPATTTRKRPRPGARSRGSRTRSSRQPRPRPRRRRIFRRRRAQRTRRRLPRLSWRRRRLFRCHRPFLRRRRLPGGELKPLSVGGAMRFGVILQDPNQPKKMSEFHLDQGNYSNAFELRLHGDVTDFFSWTANFNALIDSNTLAAADVGMGQGADDRRLRHRGPHRAGQGRRTASRSGAAGSSCLRTARTSAARSS